MTSNNDTDVDQIQREWEELCAALNTVRIHDMGEAWHRQCRNEELRKAARRWHMSCDEPQIIRNQLEDILVELSLRLQRSRKAADKEHSVKP